jgi:hypothetical protein
MSAYPETVEFEYRGKKHKMVLRRLAPENKPYAYMLPCPKCGLGTRLVFDSHQVEVRDGLITVSPSLVCPQEGCGWHVWLKNGVATDC